MSRNIGLSDMQILLVTSDRSFAKTATDRILGRDELTVQTVGSVEAAVDAVMGEPHFDCIVSDHDLPDTDGIAFLETIRVQFPSLPFILFTSEGNEEVASNAITAGVTDYLIKERHADQWDRLTRLIGDAVRFSRTHQEIVSVPDRAQTLLDNSFDMIAVIRNGTVEYLNRTGQELLAVPGKETVVGTPVQEWVETEGRGKLGDHLRAVENGSEIFDQRTGTAHRAPDGPVPVRLTATRVTWEDGPAVVLVVRDVQEQRELERELAVKERAMDEAPVGVTIIDRTNPENPFVYVNEKVAEMTEYSETALRGANFELLQGDGTEEGVAFAELEAAIEAAKPATVELEATRKDGTEFWNRISVAPIPNSEGRSTHVVAFQTDVTAKKGHERKLNRFRQSVEAAGHAIYMTDPSGEIYYVNPAFERITGYTESEAIGETPRVLNSAEMPEDYYATLWESIRSGDIWEEVVINRRKDGALYYAEQTIAPITRADGTITSYVAIQTDITERKRSEQVLEQFKQLVERSKDLLAAVDADGTYVFANQEYRRFHGVDAEDLSGRRLSTVLSSEAYETIKPEIDRAFSGAVVQTTVRREHPEKGPRILAVRLSPLERSDGEIHSVGASMRDITTERKHERAIERESEFRRLMSEVNQELVRRNDLETVVASVTDIIGSSPAFNCTFTHLFETLETNVTCQKNSGLTEQDVHHVHSEAYVEQVFEHGVFQMADVTGPPHSQHDGDTESHAGVAIAISHDGQRFGTLTAHLTPETELTEEVIAVLETIGNDLGYFVSNQLVRAEYKSFTEIVERIDDPVMLQNREGAFRVINEAVSALAGEPKPKLMGRDEFSFMDDRAARTVHEMKERVLETEEPVSYQITPSFPDGRTRTYSTTRYPYYDEQGRLDGTIAICRDITDLEAHQRQLQVLDRVLRHNVNNNMNVVQGYAEMVSEQADGELARYASRITNNSRQLLEIAQKQRKITDFLSKPDPIERIELDSVVAQLIDRLQSRHPTVDITAHVPTEIEVHAIRAIEEAIEELLTNSIVHSNQSDPAPTVRVDETPETAQITVTDENHPIPAMDRAVFSGDTDLSELHHGSGLGLWLVKLIVNHSNGTVAYEPHHPRGNAVVIELPKP